MTPSLVWFKRDLRLHDHAALTYAAAQGPVLCLYVIEPDVWAAEDAANQHYQFLLESLTELDAALQRRGGRLHIAFGEVTAILGELFEHSPLTHMYSHEETGNNVTYQRDLAVGKWCREHGVTWHESRQFGVVRRLSSRNKWQRQWEEHVRLPCLPVPQLEFAAWPLQQSRAPTWECLGLTPHDPPQRQRGGRRQGIAVLQSFLLDRSGKYRGGISSPLSAPTACSRLSPYLAMGSLSMREIVHATRKQLATMPATESRRKAGLTGFTSRLYWHCHFIQKLESEPALEYRNLHRGYDGLREGDWNQQHFDALMAGRTGWPLVDACVEMLRQTGWLNFRMRAMLVSVAAYPLWLHWRPVGLWLARQFLDYEPGIHWSQLQMQSGTTGINVPRIYNPIKQAHDHDPHGHFVRRWLPAMRKVPDAWLFEPWRMPAELQARYGVVVGHDIAMPLVDLEQATRLAKDKLFGLRAQPAVRDGQAAIVEKHGSRRRGRDKTDGKTAVDTGQMTLGF
ncbi:FAD-binding domain-containing protein [Actimicrobium sp. CCC2.4]|uniref:cryptochrome/deoxyribodipyrimidine photo-lyase family protein n=1 Tax=Actimicrobium sp. CCC2.4 TaxID=3048606 RepID=UPI002AC8D145|nr:FAD-binding domain-containing protein [Actimicrobium sp. CCC2.4]MEB0136534.1 FAD-binding domain-containing protein [Actimicrobium sp. CCC2.4]WPX30892.1 FAD-binding domain-containing protein [Actimicrobium sp. CCC2.4]